MGFDLRRHVYAYLLTCLYAAPSPPVARLVRTDLVVVGSDSEHVEGRLDDSSGRFQSRAREWQVAAEARFNAACELRAHGAGGSRERRTTSADDGQDAALQLRHQSVRNLQRVELCTGCLERDHSTHELCGLRRMFDDSVVEHSRADIFGVDG